MSTPEELEETIEAGLATLDPHSDALRDHPAETIVPALATAPERSFELSARSLVERLARVKLDGDDARLVLGEVLGEGGMGLVRVADQTSLGRKVAVKSIRASSYHPSEAATYASDPGEDPDSLKLLHEAWVTGTLEHPNIVPVHDVVLDQEGHPLIVLKRIEGVTWSDLLKKPTAVRERFGAKDLLDWNLRIFTQVCNAVSFAHSRGIIHRDLKPQNVMIGAFGEVYVLDWGIAVALREDGVGGRLRLAREVREMAGTPLYMAPEMLAVGAPNNLSERTDVYLLGAILHEIITGRPPHAPEPGTSHSVQAFVSSVMEFRPSFASDARAELTSICRKALEHEPADRYSSAAELRVAVEDFLLYRGSAQVAEQARESLEQLVARVAETSPTPTGSATIDGAAEHRDIYNLFGECRFGFEAALRVWPENQLARDGLRRAQTVMIEYETRNRDLKAAATLLAQLDDPPEALHERVAQLERETEAARREAQKLVQLGRDLDLSTGRRTRTSLALLIGLAFTLTPLLRDPTIHATTTQAARLKMLTWPVAFLAIVGLIYLVKRRNLQTATNRRFYGGVMLALAAQILVHVGGMLLNLPIHAVHVMLFGLWFCVVAMLAIAVNPQLTYGAVGYLVGFLIAARWPELRFYAMTGANGLMTINGTALWLSQQARRSERAQERA